MWLARRQVTRLPEVLTGPLRGVRWAGVQMTAHLQAWASGERREALRRECTGLVQVRGKPLGMTLDIVTSIKQRLTHRWYKPPVVSRMLETIYLDHPWLLVQLFCTSGAMLMAFQRHVCTCKLPSMPPRRPRQCSSVVPPAGLGGYACAIGLRFVVRGAPTLMSEQDIVVQVFLML